MTRRLLLAALVLAALPGLAPAQDCEDARQTCAEGQVWDSTTGTCVEKPTS